MSERRVDYVSSQMKYVFFICSSRGWGSDELVVDAAASRAGRGGGGTICSRILCLARVHDWQMSAAKTICGEKKPRKISAKVLFIIIIFVTVFYFLSYGCDFALLSCAFYRRHLVARVKQSGMYGKTKERAVKNCQTRA